MLKAFIKLPFVTKNFVLSIFEWPLKTGLLFLYFQHAVKLARVTATISPIGHLYKMYVHIFPYVTVIMFRCLSYV